MGNTSTTLDPTAQTLTQAIAMQEGGGTLLPYTAASGDEPNDPSGTAGGRYQFTSATWKNYAQQVLGNANAPMTPENQNQVAYTKIKSWLDAGNTPAQAASMWNAGEGAPDAWKPGTQQAHGNTPQYVKNVQKFAQQLSSGNSQSSNSQGSSAGQIPQTSLVVPPNIETNGTAQPPPPPQGASPVPLQGGTPGQPSNIPAQGNTPSWANVGANLKALPGAAYGAITSLPGSQIGQDIGSSLAGPVGAISPLLHGNPQLALDTLKAGLSAGAKQNSFSNVGEKTIGDIAQSVALPATLAMGGGEGTTATARILNAGLKYGAGGAITGAGGAASTGGTAGQIATQGLVGGISGALGGAILQGGGEGLNALSKNSNISAIVNKLMPTTKVSGPEVRAAMNDGRIIDGTKSTFWGSTPDTIAPRAKTIINAQTLEKNIPGIADMSPQNMVRAIDDTTDTALEGLQKPMQTVPVTQADTGKVFDAWGQLKQTQADNPHFYDAPSTAKMQTQFERYLSPLKWDIQDPITGQMKTPTPKTLADVTQTLRDYDGAVDDDVKNLKPNADRTDRLQHKTWLQNRTLLTSLRDDLGARLPGGTQQTFREVSNMLDARRALVQNARISTKGAPGLIQKATGYTARQVGTGLGIAAGAGGIGGLVSHLLPQQNSQ